MTAQGIATLVSRNHQLQEIIFDGCRFLNEDCLNAIAFNCHMLKKVCLIEDGDMVVSRITDEGFILLLTNNPELEDIEIDTEMLTDHSILAIAKFCNRLNRICLWQVSCSDHAISTLVCTIGHGLKEIWLGNCFGLTDICLKAISNSCKSLQTLMIVNFHLFTGNSLVKVTANNPDLEQLCFFGSELNDANLVAIGHSCNKLKEMVLNSRSNQITDQGVIALVTSNPYLEGIHLQVDGLTNLSFLAIAKHCPRLKRLHMNEDVMTDEEYWSFRGKYKTDLGAYKKPAHPLLVTR